jgi:O-succinylbenzoate synthase
MRIVGVAYRIVRWPIEARGAAAVRPNGLGWREREAVIIAVRGDDGSTGLGEAAPLPGLSPDTIADGVAVAELLGARVPHVLDTPAHASAIADRITTAPAARFAVESALLAAYAQRTRTSVASLLAHRVPQAELHRAVVVDDEHDIPRGARWLKIKVSPPGVSAAVERVRRISRAAPRARLRLDANRAWSRGEALALLAGVADLPIEYVEEPCVDAHELLAEPLPCRIALDESLATLAPAALTAALESPQLAALVLKPTLLGGMQRCLALAAEAHRHGVAPLVSHALEGPIGFAACIELARAIGADVPVGLGPHSALDNAYG